MQEPSQVTHRIASVQKPACSCPPSSLPSPVPSLAVESRAEKDRARVGPDEQGARGGGKRDRLEPRFIFFGHSGTGGGASTPFLVTFPLRGETWGWLVVVVAPWKDRFASDRLSCRGAWRASWRSRI